MSEQLLDRCCHPQSRDTSMAKKEREAGRSEEKSDRLRDEKGFAERKHES